MAGSEVVPFNDLQAIAEQVSKSGMFGQKSTQQVLVLMLMAQAEGMHPAAAMRDYDVILGKPSKKSEAMLRDFIKAGGAVKWNKLDEKEASATFTHQQGGTVTIKWTYAQAESIGLVSKKDSLWPKYPRAMLRSRVISEGVRSVCPSATSGMYVPEEIKDMGKAEIVPADALTIVQDQPQQPVEYETCLTDDDLVWTLEPPWTRPLIVEAWNAAADGFEALKKWWQAQDVQTFRRVARETANYARLVELAKAADAPAPQQEAA